MMKAGVLKLKAYLSLQKLVHGALQGWHFGTFAPPAANEPRTYGGFYTQDDIKEIVQYAKESFVNIMPEIDVPGHSMAAIAAYPELSCSGGVKNIGVSSGENIKDWDTHTAIV